MGGSASMPLTVWFQAIYLMTQDKKGGSAMKLHRHLGDTWTPRSAQGFRKHHMHK